MDLTIKKTSSNNNELNNSITLEKLVELGTINEGLANYLKDQIIKQKTILVTGTCGSGKTVLLQSLVNELYLTSPENRIGLVQEFDEIETKHIKLTNTIFNDEVEELFSLGGFIKSALKHGVDNLVVGDISDDEVKYLLHSGRQWFATIIGTSAESALHNLEQFSINNGYLPFKKDITQNVNIIVFMKRINKEYKVSTVTEICGWDQKNKVFETNIIFRQE